MQEMYKNQFGCAGTYSASNNIVQEEKPIKLLEISPSSANALLRHWQPELEERLEKLEEAKKITSELWHSTIDI